MIQLEEYQFHYDLFLAEQELFDSMINIGSTTVHESTGIIYIQESVKDTIMKYLSKVVEALEVAWNKFKEIIENVKDKEFITRIKDKISSVKPSFIIRNCPDYDMNFLDTVKIVPFNYGEMKEVLETKEAFIQKYYSNLVEQNKSLKESIYSKFTKGSKDLDCNSALLTKMVNTITVELPGKITSFSNEIKSFNNSNRSIESTVTAIDSVTASKEATSVYMMYLKEEKKEEKPEFEEKQGVENENKSSSGFTKHVSNYVKVSSDILSAKMKCYRDVFAFYMRTIKHQFKADKPKEEQKEEKQTSSSSDIEVNVDK
jgi:hypothetical protein